MKTSILVQDLLCVYTLKVHDDTNVHRAHNTGSSGVQIYDNDNSKENNFVGSKTGSSTSRSVLLYQMVHLGYNRLSQNGRGTLNEYSLRRRWSDGGLYRR